MFLQGPYFSAEGGPGTPQDKILVRTLNPIKVQQECSMKSLSTILLRLYQWLVQAAFATEAKQSISVRYVQKKNLVPRVTPRLKNKKF